MPMPGGPDIVHRYDDNPIIDINALSFRCGAICNAGVTRHNGRTVLLITIQSLEGTYAVFRAFSDDGVRFEIDKEPFLFPDLDGPRAPYEKFGILDARITRLEDAYYIAYDGLGSHGYCLGLARTTDFESVEYLGISSQPDTKGGVLFPQTFDGMYCRLERPWEGGSIWVSFSRDLRHWGYAEPILPPRGGFWDTSRTGCAAQPMRIDQGWLVVYYGVKDTSAGPLFRLGAAILDKDDPRRLVGRTNVPILSPRTAYERMGDIPNLVFSCGALLEDDGTVKLYYGASNSCIALGTTKVETIVETCIASMKEF